MSVRLLDTTAQNRPLEEELVAAYQRVINHGKFILGPEVEQFENAVAEYLGCDHAIGVSSGSDALLLALMALGIGPGDEVLCPAFTFFATAGSVSRTGATPVFVDNCPVCFNIDTGDAAAKVTSNTKAIIPVHLFGQSADMDAVMQLANQHELKVIEDAAQAIGASYRGQKCGTFGHFGAFSFFPSKNLGGFGDGGLLTTNDANFAEHARVLRVHGSQPKYFHQVIGGNFRLDAVQAALLALKLQHLDSYTESRNANARYYEQQLSQLPGVRAARQDHCKCLINQSRWLAAEGIKLVLPVAYDHCHHVWNQYTLRVPGTGRRDALRQHLLDHGIGCEIYYPLTLDQQACFADLPATARTGCTTAHQLAEEVLSIPIYPELSIAQKDEVVGAIADFVQAGK